jgi:uncharacterized protein YbaP (TraB family)
MAPPIRAVALLAAMVGLGCELWEPELEPIPEPKLDFPEPEFDVPLFELEVGFSLWLAKSAVGSFYLFGSAQRDAARDYASLGPEVGAAYAASQEVVREVDLDSARPAEVNRLLERYGTLKHPATLRSRVSEQTWALLEQRFARTGRSTDEVSSMQPWLVSFALASPSSLVRALDPLPGLADPVQVGVESSKPVVGLRTVESQFKMLASLPRGVQDLLLRSALGAEGQEGSDLPSASVSRERAQLYEHLIYRRNERIAERLFQIGIDGKIRFVEVGLLQLAGERGIPSLLAQRGFHVSRVQ